MNIEDVLERLYRADVSIERLLDECRAPSLALWEVHPGLYVKFVDRLIQMIVSASSNPKGVLVVEPLAARAAPGGAAAS